MIDPEAFRVHPDRFRLLDLDPSGNGDLDKDAAKARIVERNARLEELQELLWADGRHRVLLVLQAMDTGGKDSTIRRVFDGVDPSGVRVAGFKRPTDDDLAHDYLWRVHPQVPGNGELVIFNRSHYEDVLVVRVHGLVPENRWRRRYRHIREFERMLADEGTTILKVFLHISEDEQRDRLQARIDDPTKRWKFAAGDLAERARWSDYMAAFDEALRETSTEWAPWYVVPANRKWYRDLIVLELLVQTLEALELRYPPSAEGVHDGLIVE